MKFKELIDQTVIVDVAQDIGNRDIVSVVVDSREVQNGSLFVALPGAKTHGAKFIADAISRGAQIIVSQKSADVGIIPNHVCFIEVEDLQKFLAQVLKNFYHDPSNQVRLIGVTGTNGKTTITYLLEKMLVAAGLSCGVIGTIHHRYGEKTFKAGNTTPGLVENFALISEMATHQVAYCAMEVSSHALVQRRVKGFDFRYAIFTNLTSDHLDYHQNRENYFCAKAVLFESLGSNRRCIINIDDEYGTRLIKMTSAMVWTYGIKNSADFSAQDIHLRFRGSRFKVVTPIGNVEVETSLIGLHNIYNILPVIAVGVGEGLSLAVIKKGIESLVCVPGRLERIEAGQNFSVFVDYAHTQDALRNVLSSIREVRKARVIVVFGCGGDRDKTKRPLMASVVEEFSDYAIVTTDNPRTEDPQKIIDEILGGFKNKNFEVVIDRAQAIATAVRLAKDGDVVLIAGKGHEDYQIFKNETIDFDERKVVAQSIAALNR
ncbi:MAG: UDP-N-acetylmuramoyl-L-alanyl-D-glutamate--2,6-diaminopimelate ligase [Candidatus Omnitrophica bacterium]|nr:UDP-N-acetylmuramoyl-L-alanyl-D-glutamate--2,6-diaminopimelate ligase [Candidatus Omnitrophota bacterium]